ncbi:MAG TPA: hypothetical protein VMS17_14525 [Gemmataceae bacterium]|nr:hypothetical protein [Gemmataceae bacterium]
MKRMRIGLGGLVAVLLCLGALRAADMPTPYNGAGAPPSAPPTEAAPAVLAPPGPALAPGQPTSWMDYPRCLGCCGPIGRNGPIEYEIYVRNGLDFPLGGNPFGARMDAGWDVAVGARTLFFNPEDDAAWTADIGFSNVYNESRDHTTTYTLLNLLDKSTNTVVPSTTVTLENLNRTYFNLSGGREWYLRGGRDCDNANVNWRVGVDVGGRYGTEKLETTNWPHFTDVNAGVFLAVHTDLEIPCGCCIFLAGLRSEYGYTWADVLQRQNDTSDVQDINLLVNLGVRF